MRLKNVLFLTIFTLLILASPVFAQGGAEGGVGGSITVLGTVVGMALRVRQSRRPWKQWPVTQEPPPPCRHS